MLENEPLRQTKDDFIDAHYLLEQRKPKPNYNHCPQHLCVHLHR